MTAFRTSMPIRFGHEDHAQIVYFPRFLHFFHCAFEDLFAHNGIPYRECLEGDRTGWPAVHLDVDFHTPLRFGDTFLVDVETAHLGEKSAVFSYVGWVEDRKVASAKITVACIDLDSFRSQPIPAKYRALFARFMVEEGAD